VGCTTPKKEVLIAIQQDNYEKILSLVKNKEQANWMVNERPLLFHAAYYGRDDIAHYLIKKGADILWDNGTDNSILHAASYKCVYWLVEAIIAKNPKQLNMPSKGHSPTPIELATASGCETTVKILMQTGKLTNKGSALKSALEKNNYKAGQIILDSLDINTLLIDGKHPFNFAYEQKDFELLIENGIDINTVLDQETGETLLYKSFKNHRYDLVRLCLLNNAAITDYKIKHEKHKIVDGSYDIQVNEVPVLDYLFSEDIMDAYYSKNWIDAANVLIDKACAENKLHLIMSDYKTVVDLVIKGEYTSVLLNLVYQGERLGLKIKQANHTRVSPIEYVASSPMEHVMPKSYQLVSVNQKIFDAIDANNITKLRQLYHADNYYAFKECTRTIQNGKHEKQANIFEYAINSGHINVVKYLLSNNFSHSISQANYYIAVNNRDIDMFQFLMKANEDFEEDKTWILYRIQDPVFVEMLLKKGVNADEYIFNGQSFLFYAIRAGNVETIKLFIKYSEEISNDYKKLFFAIEKNDPKTVHRIIQSGIDINQPTSGGLTPLGWAAFLGRYDMAKLLIESNAEVSISWTQNENNYSYPIHGSAPVRWAIKNKHADIVKLLIDNKASPIIYLFLKEGVNAFHLNAINGNLEIMQMLMEAYGDIANIPDTINSDYSSFYDMNDINVFKHTWLATPFDIAAYYGHVDLCQLFLTNGFNVDNTDKSREKNYTPLFFSVAGGQFETSKFLIEKGANINPGASNTIIEECPLNGTSDILQLLINKGAKVDKEVLIDIVKHMNADAIKTILKTDCNQLPISELSFDILYHTIKNERITNKTALLKFLIDKGVNINAQGKNKATALHIATEINDEQLVRFLVDNGADLNQISQTREFSHKIHKTPIDLANYYPIYKTLKQKGAKTAYEAL